MTTNGGAGTQAEAVGGLGQDARRFLRVFGVIVAVWVTLLAVTAPTVERPVVLWTGVGIAWVWGLGSILISRSAPWVWGSGWLVVAVALELLGPASGTQGWSVAGGSALLVIAAAALTQRRAVLGFVVGTLSAAVVARGIFAPEHTIGASLGTLVLFVFSAVSVWWLVQTVLSGERERDALRAEVARVDAERAVAQERAESAARLHDSVLQSLAAIHRVGDVAEAQAYAGQASSEMRAWIRDRTATASTSLRERLEARVVENGAGRVGFSSTGDAVAEERHRALVDAAVEAVRNAVNHTDGDVRVYLECRSGLVTTWVADRGPSFAVESVPEDRHGVRNSIIGRMERAGGTAVLSSSSDGNEWELCLPESGSIAR